MKHLALAALAIGFVVSLAGAALAARPCTLTSRDGKVTVDLGGFGGDNVIGVVTDPHGVPIQGAEVDVANRSNGQAGDDQSGVRGGYDIDLDAKAGHVVDVFVTWTDARGVKRQVQGTCTL